MNAIPGDAREREFSAPWGTALWVVSLVVTTLLVGITVAGLSMTPASAQPIRLLMVAPLLILAGASLFVVRGYTVAGNRLLIRRLLWTTELDLTGLRSARQDRAALRLSLRLWGNGGLYSITGYYWNRQLGLYRTFLTDLSRTVVLDLPQRTVLVSPDDPATFVAKVTRAAGAA
jgi:hypothetical protein